MPRLAARDIHAGYRLLTGHFREGPAYGMVRPEGTSDWLLLYTASGRGRIGLPDGVRLVGPGELILYRPGTRQDYRTDRGAGAWELLWAHCIPADAWLDLLDWPELAPGVLHLRLAEPATAERVREALTAMVEDGRGTSALAQRLTQNGLERALLACQRALPGEGIRRDPRVRACLDLLSRTAGRPPTVSALARQVGLSPSRLAHLFQATVGLGIVQWRDQRRIQAACELLEGSGHSIRAVAQAVGFPTQAAFANRFRQLVGASPRAWRADTRRRWPKSLL